MAILASLGIAWAVGADELLPQARGRIGSQTDASSLAQTRNAAEWDYYFKYQNESNKWTKTEIHATEPKVVLSGIDFKENQYFKIALWDDKQKKNLAFPSELSINTLGSPISFELKEYENETYEQFKINNGFEKNAKYDIVFDYENKTITVSKHVDTPKTPGTVKLWNKNNQQSNTVDFSAQSVTLPAQTLGNEDDKTLVVQIAYDDGTTNSLKLTTNDGWHYGIGDYSLTLAGESAYGMKAEDLDRDKRYNVTVTWTAEDFSDAKMSVAEYTEVESDAYYIVGSFNKWNFTKGYYRLQSKGDGTYSTVLPIILEKNVSFIVVKGLDINQAYAAAEGVHLTVPTRFASDEEDQPLDLVSNTNGWQNLANPIVVSKAINRPEFIFNPTSGKLSVAEWINLEIWNNPKKTYNKDDRYYYIKGKNIQIKNNSTTLDWDNNWTANATRFTESVNQKFPKEKGWLVLKEVKFVGQNASDNPFGIRRGDSSGTQAKIDNNENYGWIYPKKMVDVEVKSEETTECAYKNYDQSKDHHFLAAPGTYDIYFNPEKMEIVFGGGYGWQFFGVVGDPNNEDENSGAYQSIAMRPLFEENGTMTNKWYIDFNPCIGGQFSFRQANPDATGGWDYIGSADSGSAREITKNGTFKGTTTGRQRWVSHLNGNHRFILDPDAKTLEVTGEEEVWVATRVNVQFRNGDVYEGGYGYLQMNGRTPAAHKNDEIMQGRNHGATIAVRFVNTETDEIKTRYLTNPNVAPLTVSKNQSLVLTPEDYDIEANGIPEVEFDLGDYAEGDQFNFALNWRTISDAKFSITKVGSEGEIDPAQYDMYRLRGNSWGGSNWHNFAVLDKVDDNWYAVSNIDMEGTLFEVVRTNANGDIYGTGEDKTEGTYWGTGREYDSEGSYKDDGYYIDNANTYDCLPRNNGGVHNFVLSQKGVYTIWFSPTLNKLIVYGEHKAAEMATVYFVDRKKGENGKRLDESGSVHAYVYNNEGVDSNGKRNYEDKNQNWGGIQLKALEKTETKLYDLVDPMGDGNMTIYSYSFNINRWPRLIFNDGKQDGAVQTRNLRAVNNGVYYLDDEFLPSNYYHAPEGSAAELMVYPNEYDNTEKNTIYVEAPDFVTKYEEGTKISFSISWEKDGHTLYTTGIRDTTTGILVTIGGKSYIRLRMTEAAIPNGAKMNMVVWEGDRSKFLQCTVNGHNHSGNEYSNISEYAASECAKLDNNPIAFENITYKDGGIYSRNTMLNNEEPGSIYSVVAPTSVVIVPAKGGSLRYIPDSNNLTDVETSGVDITNSAGKELKYSLNDVVFAIDENTRVDNKFIFKVKLGEEKEYWYALNSTAVKDMKPAVKYETTAVVENGDQPNAGYAANAEAFKDFEKCDITFDWINQKVYAVGVAKDPEFKIAHVKDEYAKNDFYIIDAVANDNDAYDDADLNARNQYFWTSTRTENGQTITEAVTISPAELRVRHLDAFGGDLVDHYGKVKVTVEPGATVKEHLRSELNRGPVCDGILKKVDKGISMFEVKAYTAGTYFVKLHNDAIGEGNNVIFKEGQELFELTVRPTVESVGLAINGQPIVPLGDGENSNLQDNANKSDYNLGVVLKPNPAKLYETTSNGKTITWDPRKRVCMETWMANPGTNGENVQIYFKVEKENEPSYVRREASAADGSNGIYTVPVGTKYDINNTLNTEMLGLKEGDKNNPAKVTFQVVQNGIVGKPQTVHVYAAEPINMPTEIEEIEAEDIVEGEDAEAVYYDLNGFRVDAENLLPGVYVVVKGDRTEKIYVK